MGNCQDNDYFHGFTLNGKMTYQTCEWWSKQSFFDCNKFSTFRRNCRKTCGLCLGKKYLNASGRSDILEVEDLPEFQVLPEFQDFPEFQNIPEFQDFPDFQGSGKGKGNPKGKGN